MFCTKCGHELSTTARFCVNCGQPVEDIPAVPAAQPVEDIPAAPAAQPTTAVEEIPAQEEAPVQEVSEDTVVVPERPVSEDTIDFSEASAPVSEEAVPAQKKSKKKLIIGLCSGGGVLLLLVIVAVVIALMFSSKVDTFAEYSGKLILGDRSGEYDELLERARNSEGILHLFDTFSVGGEIDDFTEYLEECKTALPDRCSEAYRSLDRLSEDYSIESYGDSIIALGSLLEEYKTSTEDKSEEMIKYIAACEKLENEILAVNENNINELLGLYDELCNAGTNYPTAVDYQDEINELCGYVSETINTDCYKDVPYYAGLVRELLDNLTSTSQPFESAKAERDELVTKFDDVLVVDVVTYSDCNTGFDAAYAAADFDRLSGILEDWEELYETCRQETEGMLEELCSVLMAVDTTTMEEDDLAAYEALMAQISTDTTDGHLATAYANAQECFSLIEGYVSNIAECKKLMALIDGLIGGYIFNRDYADTLDESSMYYICENSLNDEIRNALFVELGWNDSVERTLNGKTETWENGYTREHCEELAYYITGNKHYFYSDCGNYAQYWTGFNNYDTCIYGDKTFEQNSDGTISIIIPLQIDFVSDVYRLNVRVSVRANPDSFFDGYNIVSISAEDYARVDYKSLYVKAIMDLQSGDPDNYGDDDWSKKMKLVDINGDCIPELYIGVEYGYDSALLVNYQDDDNYGVILLESGNGFSETKPGTGLIRVCDGHMGLYRDTVYKVGLDSVFYVLFSGEYEYVDMTGESEEIEYRITAPVEEEDTTADIYNDYFDSCYTRVYGASEYLQGELTASEMIALLSSDDMGYIEY